MRPAGRVTNAPRRVGEMRPVNLLAVGGEYYIARALLDQWLSPVDHEVRTHASVKAASSCICTTYNTSSMVCMYVDDQQ
jgi:hypothetical protein